MTWPASGPGRLLERNGDVAPRGMTVQDRTRLIGRLRHPDNSVAPKRNSPRSTKTIRNRSRTAPTPLSRLRERTGEGAFDRDTSIEATRDVAVSIFCENPIRPAPTHLSLLRERTGEGVPDRGSSIEAAGDVAVNFDPAKPLSRTLAEEGGWSRPVNMLRACSPAALPKKIAHGPREGGQCAMISLGLGCLALARSVDQAFAAWCSRTCLVSLPKLRFRAANGRLRPIQRAAAFAIRAKAMSVLFSVIVGRITCLRSEVTTNGV